MVQDRPSWPDKPFIAVLTFENMSGDPDQEYLISADIITALSRSPRLFTIARNTTFTFKGTNLDVQRVAEDRGVRTVLEGSVRQSCDKVRVSAQLIESVTRGSRSGPGIRVSLPSQVA